MKHKTLIEHKNLLVNYVYWQNVGHMIEALRYALGYHLANPSLEISLAVNKHTPYFLADLFPWIKQTYVVDLPDEKVEVTENLYKHIPREWDYIASDGRSRTKEWCPGAFYDYYQQVKKYLNVKGKSGFCGNSFIPYKPNQKLKLELPLENLTFAKKHIIDTKIKIGVLFAGAKDPEFFPSIRSWETIFDALHKQYSDLSLYFFGKLIRTDKSTLSAFERKDLDMLLRKYPHSVNCFDMDLLDQLAIVQQLDLFFSPHTGFGFAVACVDTPWLTLSGGRWKEYFFNGTPFYSVLPDPKKYPCFENPDYGKTTKDDGTRILSMSRKRILEDMPEILKGADILINKKWNYEKCLRNYFDKLVKFSGGDTSKIWSFDNIHKKYIK